MKPHKHAELIKAWADGAEIEYWDTLELAWLPPPFVTPSWGDENVYRIKPQPKPDFVRYACYDVDEKPIGNWLQKQFRFYIDKQFLEDTPNVGQLKIIFDGETNKIKSIEVLK